MKTRLPATYLNPLMFQCGKMRLRNWGQLWRTVISKTGSPPRASEGKPGL